MFLRLSRRGTDRIVVVNMDHVSEMEEGPNGRRGTVLWFSFLNQDGDLHSVAVDDFIEDILDAMDPIFESVDTDDGITVAFSKDGKQND